MQRIRTLTLLAAPLAVAALSLLPSTAQAKRKSPLAGKPVVVNKLELRKLRFAVTPVAAMSLSQPFVHEGYVGGKLQFYITDWIGVRGTFMYSVLQLDARLLRAVQDENGGLARGIPDETTGVPIRAVADKDNPAPLYHDFQAGLTHNQWLASADVVFTPFNGKLGLFSGIFTEYDIYLFGGLGLSGWNKFFPNANSTSQQLNLDGSPENAERSCRPEGIADAARNEECLLHPVLADTGVKLGPSFGAGLHMFLGVPWAAVNLEVQDIMSYNNIAGQNRTTDDVPPVVDNSDAVWNHNVTFQLGVKFYFPPKAKRSKYPPSTDDKKGGGKGKASASVSTKK